MSSYLVTLPIGCVLDLADVPVSSVTVEGATRKGVTFRVVPVDPAAAIRRDGSITEGRLRLTIIRRGIS